MVEKTVDQIVAELQGKLTDIGLDKASKAVSVAKKIAKEVPEIGPIAEGLANLAFVGAVSHNGEDIQKFKVIFGALIICSLAIAEVK